MTSPQPDVLIVDDEPQIRRFLRAGFELEQFAVLEAESAEAGLRAATLRPIDLIVVDLGLPDIPGEELVSELRARYPLLPIIVASGRGTGDIDASVRSLQNMIILPKPYDFEELRRAIENLQRRLPPK